MQTFTRKQLAQSRDRNGIPVYIAYEGKVYDTSGSFLWQKGRHQARHTAGVDYTNGLDQAPHGPDLLERLPLIGVLVEGDDQSEQTPAADA
jgi:predicted heme/steroid binding protein